MKNGACDFLSKPFQEKQLLEAIQNAICRNTEQLENQKNRDELKKKFDSMTPREKEVYFHVVSGKLNKQIGYELKITEKTIKVHRSRVMTKMEANSLAELVQLAEKLKAWIK
jgi:RNA polymerase sigma factor (sigma-70 family)